MPIAPASSAAAAAAYVRARRRCNRTAARCSWIDASEYSRSLRTRRRPAVPRTSGVRIYLPGSAAPTAHGIRRISEADHRVDVDRSRYNDHHHRHLLAVSAQNKTP